MHFYDQFKNQLKESKLINELEYLHKKWEGLFKKYKQIKRRNNNCKGCLTPWTHKNCFYLGFCKTCRNKRDTLGKIKVELPKYKNKNLKFVRRYDEEYLQFCIKNKTRQHDIFNEYINYF
jgi:hypothetical protein